MKFRLLILTTMICLSFTATAQIVTITRAYEIAVSELRLPGYTAGTISFKECGACDSQTVRVTAATRYVLNGVVVPLGEFKKALKGIRKKDTTISTVMHHLESDTVVDVIVVKK